jgi:hypothetical protein
MNRRVSHLIAGWRTGLSRPVLILQGGNALNYFGYGLVLRLARPELGDKSWCSLLKCADEERADGDA